jgi:multiple sugar transport system ATP-binding protein
MTMGSRIAVLNAGIVQQLGTPQELYDHPANLFTAGFIGSPAMNFFPGARVVSSGELTQIVLDGMGSVDVPPWFAGQAREAAGRNLTFGIRPEHLADRALLPGTDELVDASVVNATVDVVENLGNELLVYLTAGEGNKTLQARLNPRSQVGVGRPVSLQVDTDHIHLFDADTEQAIF